MTTPIAARSRPDAADRVAITSPANNAQVHDIVNVTADATDNVGVVGVQFLVDGAAVGAEDPTPPVRASPGTRARSRTARTR